ncbi:MAG: glutamate synthase subunit beta [Eubacterium sp.]|nr:glutamate synthase subunit beta [Eubacterium sp.]
MLLMQDNTQFVPVENPNMQEKRTKAATISLSERLGTYNEIETTYSKDEAENEADRCLKCPTHWCQKMCPAGVPVTDFIAALRAGNPEEAYRLIRTASAFPEFCSRVCPKERQCQSNCTRSINSEAVSISRLERFVTETHYASGNGEPATPPTNLPEAGDHRGAECAPSKKSGKKVAVIGSGPSGLAAAQFLTDYGHSVTVYEKDDRPGGLLEYGIPNMKLEKGVVARKIDSLKNQGVEFVLNTAVGKDVSPEELKGSFDAVVLAVGTRNARMISAENMADAKGVYTAVEYLTQTTKTLLDGGDMAGRSISAAGKNVVIVGGGDTGNDCVGTAIRDGALSVTQIEMLPKHRKTFEVETPRMDPLPDEPHSTSQEEAKVKFSEDPHVYETTVKAVEKDASGNVAAVTVIDLEARYDAYRVSMSEVPGTERTIPCDMLLIAAGFTGPEKAVTEAFGVSVNERTNIIVGGSVPYMTDVDKVFACGDCHTGQSLVCRTMTDARECAKAVHGYLSE